MLKYIGIIFLLISQYSRCFAQGNYVANYHTIIHQAEMNLIKASYEISLKNYKMAFSNVSCPFAKDYYNALICSVLLKKEKEIFIFLEKLKEKHLSLSFIEKIPEIEHLKETKKWKKFKRNFQKLNSTINIALAQKLDSLHYKDQFFRQLDGGYKKYGDTITKTDIQNIKNLLLIIEKQGFPTEDQIGISTDMRDMHNFLIVIRHQVPPSKYYDFTEILKKAILDGKISPYVASYLMDLQNLDELYGYPSIFRVSSDGIIADKKWYYFTLTKEKENIINGRRAQIGLETLEEYRKKLVFSLTNKQFIFQLKGTSTYLDTSNEIIELFMSKSKIVSLD